MLGAKAGASADPDGYTLTITNVTTMSLIPAVNRNTSYDAMKDFTHIAYLAGGPIVLAVFPGTGAKTVKDFIKYAESGGKPLTFGSIGVGSDGHIVGEAIGQALGIKVQHLAYRGGTPPAMADVIAGHITYLPMTIAQTAALVKDGKLNGLAITAPARMRQLPDVPTFKELGYPNLVSLTWFSVSGPAHMPRNIAEALHGHIADMLKKPEILAKFNQIGLITQPMSFDEVTKFVAAEGARWKPLIEAAGLLGKAE
jgi:tripartite-type tricarboxylate transporter receptor subunit TctC